VRTGGSGAEEKVVWWLLRAKVRWNWVRLLPFQTEVSVSFIVVLVSLMAVFSIVWEQRGISHDTATPILGAPVHPRFSGPGARGLCCCAGPGALCCSVGPGALVVFLEVCHGSVWPS
jgi:hypothetical protein